MKKRILPLLLCLVMCISLVPAFSMTAYAAEYSETVSGTVGVPMDEIVYYVGDDGTYPGKAELVSGNMPNGIDYDVDNRGYVHFVGTPEETGTFEVSFYTEEYDSWHLYQSGFGRTIVIATPYDVWVGGEQFTSNKLTITCGTGTATYDPGTNTVTLDGAQITSANSKGAIYAGDQADRTLTVNVVGDSSIHLDSDTKTIGGIYADTLVLNASNNLDICVDNKDSGGIYTNGRDVRFPDSGDVTINGDGDVTISAGDNGISSTGSVTFSGSGDVTIAARSNGIYCYDNVTINGSGNVNIASQYSYGVFEYGDVTISNSANVKIKGFYSGVYIGKVGESGRNLILSGSGKVDIGGTQRGVTLCGDGKVFLNGTGSLIKLHAGTASLAVYNGDTKESPVVGANIDKYDVTGDPASASVAYTWKGNSYNVWIGDVQVTDANKDNVLGDGTVSCDPVTNTVTLDGAQITKASKAGAIYAENALTVKVIGDSSIILDSNTRTQGIYAMGDLVLTGPGNLEISVESEHNGIEVWGDVTISGSGDVTVNAGEFGIFIVEDSMGSLILSGSGKVDIYGKCDGVLFWDDDSAVLLNGTCSSITLHAGEEYKAVCNGNTQESPVAGSNLDDYEVIGDPASASVIYCKHENTELRGFVAPTCKAEGCSGDIYCMDCGKKVGDSNPIPKMEHYYVTSAMHDPTCTEDGYGEMTCKYCGDKFTFKTDDAYGHHEVTDKAVAATYAKTGKTAGSHCDICGAVLTAQKTVAMKKLAQAKISSITNTSTGITVKWGKVTGATAYQVYRKVGTGSWKLIKTTTSTSVSNSSLTNGTKYQYKVRAVVKNSAGKIVNTGKDSTVKAMYRLTRPTLASGTKNIATRKIVVKWNKNTKVTGYQVKYIKGTTTKTVTVKGASSLTKTLSSLTKGSTYKVYVRSYKTVSGTNYYSAWSAYKSVKVAK